MRNLSKWTLLAAGLFAVSCNKTLKVDPVSFDVTTASSTFKAGDTVTFLLKGDPNMITFYSGEPGSNYDYRERTTATGKPLLQFLSYSQYGTQDSALQLLVSTDFDATYDSANVYKAHWTDVTNQATLSTGDDSTASGAIDLSSLTSAGKPFYFAFKFTGDSGSTQKTWTITNFQVNLLQDGGYASPVTGMSNAGWKAVNIKNSKAAWSISATQVKIAGGNASALPNEDWLIAGPIDAFSVMPDKGVAIKDITTSLSQYQYVYSRAGTFKPVFVAVNATADGEKSVEKQLNISVNP